MFNIMAAQADFQEFTSPPCFLPLFLTTRRITGLFRTGIDDPPVVPVSAVVLTVTFVARLRVPWYSKVQRHATFRFHSDWHYSSSVSRHRHRQRSVSGSERICLLVFYLFFYYIFSTDRENAIFRNPPTSQKRCGEAQPGLAS